VAVWLSGNVVGQINEVTLRRDGWPFAGTPSWCSNQATRPTQPGHSSVGRRNEY